MFNRYVCHRRAKFDGIGGKVNIPYGTVLTNQGGILMHKGSAVCMDTSQHAYDFFSCDDDGCGLERGCRTADIIKILGKPDGNHQERWDRLWSDASLQKYRRPEHLDHWLWNYDFFCAPVKDLEYIRKLIKEV